MCACPAETRAEGAGREQICQERQAEDVYLFIQADPSRGAGLLAGAGNEELLPTAHLHRAAARWAGITAFVFVFLVCLFFS